MLQYAGQKPLPDASLWRYMSLAAFLATLSGKQLRLTRLDRFDDPFEGTVPQAELQKAAQQFFEAIEFTDDGLPPRMRGGPPDVRRRSRNFADEMRQRRVARLQCAHASCWRYGDESEGMWRLYCNDDGTLGQGVAVRTTVPRLFTALDLTDVYVSPIAYRPYHEGPPFFNDLDCFFHKRRGFAHEQEVRILTYDADRSLDFTRYIAGFIDDEPSVLPDYRFVSFDLAVAVDELLISPYASDNYVEKVRDAIAAQAPELLDLVHLSELSERRYGRGL